MQIERLVQIIFYLVEHKHTTAKELAALFKVSTRTIYRDINTLTIAGIPILSTKGNGGGISLLEGYTMDRSLLTKGEQQNIFQGLQILQATQYPNMETTLNKIGAIFRTALQPQWLEIDFSYWGSDDREKFKISDVQSAILNKHVITFEYVNSDMKKSRRMVEPMRLVFKSHAWYIVGYCQSKQEVRVFRLSRIRDLKINLETFERELPEDYSLKTQKQTNNLVTLKLRFSPESVHRLYDEFSESQLKADEDGCYVVEFQAELNNWLVNYLLSFGRQVEVLAPAAARTQMRVRSLDIAELYQD
ncbi:DeoR family transcriptional regulator [Enterococcus florum]|uniref:DeoR family transcriptional regulator n=1 Tax=Enterococcus florum TaxID=2480627 RepID=A0A4P5PC42_9ENTE|nr:YafY family protein [Enterococcus florum]GCF95346.1 DeoR family transcriptional regulator [Enterococcus florum]